jgi:hypothetical protein
LILDGKGKFYQEGFLVKHQWGISNYQAHILYYRSPKRQHIWHNGYGISAVPEA